MQDDSERTVNTAEEDIEALLARAFYRGPSVTADRLVGLDACLRQLGGQLALIDRPELATRFGLEPSGTLLIGPPGTGKTLVARYLAGRLDLPLYTISADEFSDPELVHAVFRRLAGERAILFIDEVSLLAQRREFSTDRGRRMLAALLTELDGLADEGSRRLMVIGACTPDIHLDPAIHRSGRLGVVVEFAPPSEAQRRALFDLYLDGVPHTVAPAAIERLAAAAGGATGADIRDWVSQAASEVLAEAIVDEPVIEDRHLEAVVARRGFIAAEGRPGREPDMALAVHEAAHAVLCWSCFGPGSLARVSVGFGTPTGAIDAFVRGHFRLSDDWALSHPPTDLTWLNHVSVALAGTCAEELVLGSRGAGAEHDVAAATSLILGLLDTGDPAFGPSRSVLETGPVMGTVAGAEAMREAAWELCRGRFDAARTRTMSLVERHSDEIERLARALLESKRTLTGDEIVAAIVRPGEPG